MTFSPVGSFLSSANVSTLSVTPHAAAGSNFFIIHVNNSSNATVIASSLASANAIWFPLTTSFAGTTNAQTVRSFIGIATSTATANVTVTWSGTTPAGINIAGHEYTTTVGAAAVVLDTSGHIDGAGTNTWASLTPLAAGELYAGWCGDSGTAGSITTAGYSSSQDSNGNGIGFNASCTAAAQAPVWTDSGMVFGQMVLVREASGPAQLAQKSRRRKQSLQGPLPAPPAAVTTVLGEQFQVRSRPAAVRSRARNSPGSPVVPTVAVTFYQPQRIPRGQPAAARSRLRSAAQPFPPAPVFAVPGHRVAGQPAIRRSRLASSPGSPVVPTLAATFYLPERTTRGQSAIRRSRSASSPGSGPVRSAPFYLPGHRTVGQPALRRGRAASSPGSPVVPTLAASFVQPTRSRSRPAVARSRLSSSPGSPVVLTVITPAPFSPPARRIAGQPAARRTRASSSPGSPVVLAPAPFLIPARVVKGRGVAVRSRLAGSPGSPVPAVAGFALPGRLAGHPVARRSRLASSAGSPAVPTIPAQFRPPARSTRGQPAIRRSALRFSAGSPATRTPPGTRHSLLLHLFPF